MIKLHIDIYEDKDLIQFLVAPVELVIESRALDPELFGGYFMKTSSLSDFEQWYYDYGWDVELAEDYAQSEAVSLNELELSDYNQMLNLYFSTLQTPFVYVN